MSSPPLVSVLVPVRNGVAQLPHTLHNLLAHSTYPASSLEVLLGDHGSTDGTAELIERHAQRFPALRRIAVPFVSPNRAHVRNCLLEAAHGEIVVFIDHDVLVPGDFVQQHVQLHERYPGALVAGQTYGRVDLASVDERLLVDLRLDDIARSRHVLEATPELSDYRCTPGMLPSSEQVQDLTHELAPFRFFWTCNLSVRRADVAQCGFDEAYEGWGVEDDDFAHQLYARGKSLIFSRNAWGFHLPHPTQPLNNLLSWRRNFQLLFRKFASRELEYCSLFFGPELTVCTRGLEQMIAHLMRQEMAPLWAAAARQLPAPRGRRLAPFVASSAVACELNLTDALDPSMPLNAQARRERAVSFWPFIGFKTPFEDAELGEAVVLAELLTLLEPHQILMLLAELGRTCQRVTICYGADCQGPQRAFAWHSLRAVVSRLSFGQLDWLELGP